MPNLQIPDASVGYVQNLKMMLKKQGVLDIFKGILTQVAQIELEVLELGVFNKHFPWRDVVLRYLSRFQLYYSNGTS